MKNNTQNTNLLKDVPQSMSYHATQGAVTLDVNAQVQIPSVTKIPVTTIQSSCFMQNTVNKLINTFMPGMQLYEPVTIGSSTPRPLLEKLYTLTQALQLPSARSNLEISTQDKSILFYLYDQERQYSKFGPAYIHEQLANAPATVNRIAATGQLRMVNESDITESNGKVSNPGYHGQSLEAPPIVERDTT